MAAVLLLALGGFAAETAWAQGGPTVTAVDFVTTAGPDDTHKYKVGDAIEVDVTYSEAVYVWPDGDGVELKLILDIGQHNREATFIDGSGSSDFKLHFRYTVIHGDYDEDGISIANLADSLVGGTIESGSSIPAGRGFAAQGANPRQKVDGIKPRVTRGGVDITSEPESDSDHEYGLAEDILVSVTFDEVVHVDETVSELVLVLSIGQHSRRATFVGGSGSAILRFSYTVQRGDEDDDGISIGPGLRALQGAAVTDFAGNPVDRAFDGVPAVDGRHKVDGVNPVLDAVDIVTPDPHDGVYSLNEEIRVTVNFGEEVHVTEVDGDNLELILSIGQHSRSARLADGSGTTTLTFSYVVQANDKDDDGITIGPTALQGGLIQDSAGNPADRTFAGVGAPNDHKVDGVKPSLKAMQIVEPAGHDGVYGLNQKIMVDVAFNEEVHVDETESELVLVLAIGQHSRQATFVEGSGTGTLKFSYVVQSDDKDDDGISIGPGIDANEGSLTGARVHDKAGNVVDRTFAGVGAQDRHKVDGMIVSQAAVRIVSTPAASGTYGLSEEIRVQVNFGAVVHVTGTVTLALDIGANEREASYAGGSGTDTLEFQYVVRSNDKDDDGISIGSDALDGGTIEDGDGDAVNRAITRLAPDSSHKVDGTSASLSGVRIVSTPDSGNTYGLGEEIRVAVDFGKVVHVTDPGQDPTLLISIGENLRTATLASGSGTDTLTFRYVVQSDDQDDDGISVGANALQGGGIEDAAGNEIVRTFAGLAADGRHRVDGIAPVLDRVRIVSPPGHDGTYDVNEEITIVVEFGEEVHVKGEVTVDITIGEHTRKATFVSGSGTDALTFRYVVQADDYDDDGISIPANCLKGEVRDVAGNPVDVTYRGRASDSGHKVDGLNTARLVVRIVPPRDHDGVYGLNEEIRVVVDFPAEVHVTGGPTLTLSIGEHSREATLADGSGTKRLTFSYLVQSDDQDDDGISIGPNSLRGGVIESAEGNGVARIFAGLPADIEHRVDGVSPSLTRVRFLPPASHDGIYGLNEEIRVEVDFGEEVHITGQVSLVLSIGEYLRVAAPVSGSGTDKLTFRYVVQSGDSDDDGISIGPNALRGTSIEDAAGNAVVLAFDGLSADRDHKVDGLSPVLARVEIIAPVGHDGTYSRDEAITVEVEFGEDVHVTGGETELSIMLSIGQRLRAAMFIEGSGTEILTFRYVVQAGDSDDDGISIGPNALQGGTIEDTAGNAVVRTFNGLPADIQHTVKAVAAVVARVDEVIFKSSAGSNDTYTTDDDVLLDVVFNVPVYVTGEAPILKLSIGSVLKDALFQEGSGTPTLGFLYTVEPGDTDDDGISIGPNALIGTFEDGGGNAVDLTLPALGAQGKHRVSAELMLYPLSLTLLVGQWRVVNLADLLGDLQVDYAGRFEATSDDSSIATAEISGNMLTITSVAEGAATITAKAVDAAIYLVFGVSVETSLEETEVLEGALAAVGRGVIASAASTIGGRLESSDTDSMDVWGGRGLAPVSEVTQPQWSAFDRIDRLGSAFDDGRWGHDDPYLRKSTGYTLAQWLRGARFEMPFGGFGNPINSWSVWGAGDWHAFEGEPESGLYNGSLTSIYLGVDAKGNGWISGAAFSHAIADASYEFGGDFRGEGRLETELNVIHPYVQWAFRERGKMWAILGFGAGEATAEREGQEASNASSDLSMLMGLSGIRYDFGPIVGFDFAVRGDAGFARLETDEGPRAIEGMMVNVQRLRMGVEASLPMAFAGVPVSPFIDVAGRYDGGDGATGGGVELAGGFRYRGPMVGFEVKGRALAMHSDESYSEHGVKATLALGPDGRRGFRLLLSPKWGGTAEAMDIFTYRGHPFAGALRRENRGWGLGTRMSYGFDMRRRPGTIVPYWELDLSRDAYRQARLGVSYELASAFMGMPHRLEISGESTESEQHGSIMRFLLSGQAHF